MGLLDRIWTGKDVSLSTDEMVEALTQKPEILPPAEVATPAPKVEARSITGADLVPSYQEGRPVRSMKSTRSAILDAYMASIWVYVCARARAEAVASVPLVVQQFRGEEWSPVAPTHPLAKLIKRPNEDMSRRTVIELWMIYWLLSGRSHLGKNRAGFALPQELWPLHTDTIDPVPDGGGYLSHYVKRRPGSYITTREEKADLITLLTPDPSNPLLGLSAIRAGAAAVSSDSKTANWQDVQLDNTIAPSGVVLDEIEHPKEQFVDVSKKIKSAHQDAQMKRSLFYLDGGRRYVPLAFSKLDMDFLGAAQFTAEKICALMRVPVSVVGRMVNTTFNNVAGEQKRFWNTTVMSDLDLMIEVLNHDLVYRDFGADIRIWPDTSNIPELAKITPEKTKMAVDLGKLGVPMKEINRALQMGLQEYEGWEKTGAAQGKRQRGLF